MRHLVTRTRAVAVGGGMGPGVSVVWLVSALLQLATTACAGQAATTAPTTSADVPSVAGVWGGTRATGGGWVRTGLVGGRVDEIDVRFELTQRGITLEGVAFQTTVGSNQTVVASVEGRVDPDGQVTMYLAGSVGVLQGVVRGTTMSGTGHIATQPVFDWPVPLVPLVRMLDAQRF